VPSRGPPARHRYKCQLNLSIREQTLLPALDVCGMGWVIKRPSQSAAAEMLPKTSAGFTYRLYRLKSRASRSKGAFKKLWYA